MLDFLAYLEFERGLSRNTLEAYRSDLLQLGEHLRRTGVDALAAGHADLADFVATLAAGSEDRPPASPATLQRKVACLRSFYRHLRRQDVLTDDPTAHLRAPRQSRRLPHVLTREEVAKLLAQPSGTEPAQAASAAHQPSGRAVAAFRSRYALSGECHSSPATVRWRLATRQMTRSPISTAPRRW